MDWKNNPEAELIIDLAGRMTEVDPKLRERWIPELLRLLSVHPDVDESAIRSALRAGDALASNPNAPGTSAQRRSFRARFPTKYP